MFLIDKFQQFYGEVLRLRVRVAEGSWVFQADDTAGRPAEPRPAPATVRGKLLAGLRTQTASLEAAAPSELPYREPWIWSPVLVRVLWIAGARLPWRNGAAHLEAGAGEVGSAPAGGVE